MTFNKKKWKILDIALLLAIVQYYKFVRVARTGKLPAIERIGKLLATACLLFLCFSQMGCLSKMDKCLSFEADGSGVLIIEITEKRVIGETDGPAGLYSSYPNEKIIQRDQRIREFLDRLRLEFPELTYSSPSPYGIERKWTLRYPFKQKRDLQAALKKFKKYFARDKGAVPGKDDELKNYFRVYAIELLNDPFFSSFRFEKNNGNCFEFRCKLKAIKNPEQTRYHVKMPARIITAVLGRTTPVIRRNEAIISAPYKQENVSITTSAYIPDYDWKFDCKIASFHNHSSYGDGGFTDPGELLIYEVSRRVYNEVSWSWLKNTLRKKIASIESSRYTPAETYIKARTGKFDVYAITEHGLHLNRHDEWEKIWSISENTNKAINDFTALVGFEWTGTKVNADFVSDPFLDTREYEGDGHITVLGSKDFCDVRNAENGDPEIITSLLDFYRWLIAPEHIKSRYGGNIICQFNHPSLYDSSNHFYDFEIPRTPSIQELTSQDISKLKDIFCLIELGSHDVKYRGTLQLMTDDPHDTELLMKNIRQSLIIEQEGVGNGTDKDFSNEYWYRMALSKGWRVAPTVSEDRHAGNYGSENDITGVWEKIGEDAPSNKMERLLEALRARRTFISEGDRSLRIRFWLELGDGEEKKVYKMGDVIEEDFESLKNKKAVLNWHISSNKKGVGKVYAITVQGDPERPVRWKPDSQGLSLIKDKPLLLANAKKEYDNYGTASYNFDDNFIRAIYLKIVRPDGKCAISAPIFYENKALIAKTPIVIRNVSAPWAYKQDVLSQKLKIVHKGQKKKIGVANIKSGTQRVNFALKFTGCKMELILRDPKGKLVNSRYPGAIIETSDKKIAVAITNPEPGAWTINVKGIEAPREGGICEVVVSLPEQRKMTSTTTNTTTNTTTKLSDTKTLETKLASDPIPIDEIGVPIYDDSTSILHAVLIPALTGVLFIIIMLLIIAFQIKKFASRRKVCK